jgi:hypothetical protein
MLGTINAQGSKPVFLSLTFDLAEVVRDLQIISWKWLSDLVTVAERPCHRTYKHDDTIPTLGRAKI